MSDEERDELTLAVISERLRSIRMLVETGNENINKQLARLDDLPLKVEAQAGRLQALEQRLSDLEDVGTRGTEWRRASLPIITLTLVLVCATVVSVVTQIH